MIKKTILSLILFIGLTSGAIFAQSPEVLVRIEAAPNQSALFQLEPVRVCFRTDDYFLATLPQEQLSLLSRKGIRYQILDENPWTEPYYLVKKPAHRAVSGPLKGQEIFSGAEETLVKITDNTAFDLATKGWQLIRIFNRALPPSPPGPSFGPWQQNLSKSNALIEELIAQISDSSFRAILVRLQDFKTRYSFSDSIVPAHNWIRDQFRSYGYSDVILEPFPMGGTIQKNVIATKPGVNAPNRFVILDGHYDSVVYDGTDPMVFAPGVDDNGSGIAGTMELARILVSTQLDKTIQFIGFAAEEQGLWGSYHHAEQSYQNGKNIDLVLNMDMIANVSDNFPDMTVYSNNRSLVYARLVQQMVRAYTSLILTIASSSGGSDHYPFQQYGFPALFIQEGDFSPHWHLATDTIDNVDIAYGIEVLKATLASLVMAAIAPGTPTGLTALDMGDGSRQILSWQPNEDLDLKEYRIYYGTASGQYPQTLTTTAATDTLSGLTENQAYFAAVSALDTDGYESMFSTEISFVPRTAPLTPLGLASTSEPTQVELTWENNNNEIDFAGYRVTRRGPDTEEKIFDLQPSANQFFDTQVQPHVLYHYTIQARDFSGNVSAASTTVRGQLATHDRGILIVDGTRDGTGQALRPTDANVDDFYQKILQNFNLAGQWDLADSLTLAKSISDADLAIYSTLVWHTDVSSPQPRLSADTLALKKYLQNGGKLILSGWGLSTGLTNESALVRPFNPGNFTHDYLKIATVTGSSGNERDFIGADGKIAGYPSFTNDPAKATLFAGNLIGMEVIQPVPDSKSTILYTYRSSLNPPSEKNGQAMAIRYLSDTLKVVILDFPLYFVPESEATTLISQALLDLGEIPTRVEQSPAPVAAMPESFSLAQNYPNPIRISANHSAGSSNQTVTSIQYEIARDSQVSIKIYNLLGQVVRTLVDLTQKPGVYQAQWDGRTGTGDLAYAGIYFYELRADNFRQVRKLLIIR